MEILPIKRENQQVRDQSELGWIELAMVIEWYMKLDIWSSGLYIIFNGKTYTFTKDIQ